MKVCAYFFAFLLIGGCIEPYEFLVRDTTPSLVVEGFISDKSFIDTKLYPSEGRYFPIKLTLTTDVSNIRSVPVKDASPVLIDSRGANRNYRHTTDGIYVLEDDNFKAEAGTGYKVRIVLATEEVIESSWEMMPDTDVPTMGEVGFTESQNQYYVLEAGKWFVRTRKTVDMNVEVPPNSSGAPIYYRWVSTPTWIYVAPLISTNEPYYRCWATDPLYINTYGLQADISGGYNKTLFTFPTVRNERFFEKFSVLVTQHAMTEDYYNFWRELKGRNEGSALADIPPFNLETNLQSVSGDLKVSGYFGVTREQARRWYFDKGDLTYYIENTLKADCLVYYGPGGPAPECLDCRQYSFGTATTTRPSWWED